MSDISTMNKHLLDDANEMSHLHITNQSNPISDRYTPDDANRVNKLIYDLDRKICGRICAGSYLHGLYFVKELMAEKCKTYCEIGVFFGGSIALLMQLSFPTIFIGIDKFEGYYDDVRDPLTDLRPHLEIAKHNIGLVNHHDHSYCLLKGDSTDPETIARLEKFLSKQDSSHNKIDMLLIDGDHSKEGVLADFENYYRFVRLGGYIIFDNYSEHEWKGVKEAVDSIDFAQWGCRRIMTYGLPKEQYMGAMVVVGKVKELNKN